eukprot:UN06627
MTVNMNVENDATYVAPIQFKKSEAKKSEGKPTKYERNPFKIKHGNFELTRITELYNEQKVTEKPKLILNKGTTVCVKNVEYYELSDVKLAWVETPGGYFQADPLELNNPTVLDNEAKQCVLQFLAKTPLAILRESPVPDHIINGNHCNICFEPITRTKVGNMTFLSDGFVKLQCCGGEFCNDCFRTYLGGKIKENELPVRCFFPIRENGDKPCKCTINRNTITGLLDKYTVIKHDTYLKKADVCAYTCCYCGHVQVEKERAAKFSYLNDDKINCERCRKEYCPFHAHGHLLKKGECRKYQEDKFDTISYKMIKKTTRKCSKCNFFVHKISGCNHMTCRCKAQFCYICGGEWDNKCVENNCPQFT